MSVILALLICASADGTPAALARDLRSEVDVTPLPEAMRADTLMSWTLGPRVGYADSSDADHGTWLVGIQARLHIFSWLAAEASIDVHRDDYEGGDLEVFSIPMQVTGLVYLPVDWALRPYALAGVGWYYTRSHFSGSLSANSDETQVDFGGHAGAGLEWQLTPTLSIDADIRFIWRTEPPRVQNNFDYYQITAGVNFKLGK